MAGAQNGHLDVVRALLEVGGQQQQLVAEDSATLEDRDLVRRQAGVLARHLQHPADLP
jgi:hypothetical protein